MELIERLLGKGYELKLYDRNVNIARLVGANRDYILNRIPHVSKLMVNSIDDVLEHSETLVIGNGDNEFRNLTDRLTDGQVVVDLVRVDGLNSKSGYYEGICW